MAMVLGALIFLWPFSANTNRDESEGSKVTNVLRFVSEHRMLAFLSEIAVAAKVDKDYSSFQ